MAIHHATLKSAAAQGIELTQAGLSVRAFCPRLGCELFHDGKARAALDQMQDLIWLRDTLDAEGTTHEIVPEGDGSDHDCAALTLKVGERNTFGTPHDARQWYVSLSSPTVEMETPEEAAEALGIEVEDLTADQDDADEEERLSGSVVSEKYRAIYAEAGHPTHCGDAMAVWFDTHCANKAGTDLSLFEAICSLNGVDLAKYDRTRPGWQGRLRMTGRNMLARRVFLADGVMRLPDTMGGEKRFDADWLASRKFAQPKAKPNVAEIVEEAVAVARHVAEANLTPEHVEAVAAANPSLEKATKRDRTRKGRGK